MDGQDERSSLADSAILPDADYQSSTPSISKPAWPKRPRIKKTRKPSERRPLAGTSKHRFTMETPLPHDRVYHQVEEQLRGTLQGSLDYDENTTRFSADDQRRLWRLVDTFRDKGVASSYIVKALLDAAVDLSCTQLPPEGDAYAPFVEATADLFNHYAAMGDASANEIW